jgi:hypothetical protein
VERLDDDAAALAAIVTRDWTALADPLGSVLFVPTSPDRDPVPADEFPWAPVIREFSDSHGRQPQPGARALAARRLNTPRRDRGGRDG